MVDNNCPHCGEEYDGLECYGCGFQELDGDQYETPEGNIVRCSEEEAYEREYILKCPECYDNVITWWMKEDHGMCIDCWHKKNKSTFTNNENML